VKITKYTTQDKKKYEEFLFHSAEATIYHTLEWKKIIESSFGYHPIYLLAKNNTNQIKAVFPLFHIKNLFHNRLESIPFSIYGGAIGEKKYIIELIKEAIKIKTTFNCDSILVKQPYGTLDPLFQNKNFIKYENRWDQYIQIQEPQTLWNRIKKSNRNAIRQATKHQLEFKKAQHLSDIEEFYRLDIITKHRTGFLPPPVSFYRKMWTILHPKGNLELFQVTYQNHLIASALVLLYNQNIICICAASETKNLNLRPNNYLLWKILEWGYEHEYETIDLGMTLKDNGGLHFFKSSFNSQETSYGHFYYPQNAICLEDTPINRIGRITIKCLPVPLLTLIGPYLTKKLT
jgi:hypothetical protein